MVFKQAVEALSLLLLLPQVSILGLMCCLVFFPLQAHSLTINNPPNVSTYVQPPSVNIEWTETPGDPEYIGIQILCGTTSVLQLPIQAKTSQHGWYINNETWDGNKFRGTCNIQAFDGVTLLAEGPPFPAPPLSITEPPSSTPPPPPPSPSPSPPPSVVSTDTLPGTTTRHTPTPTKTSGSTSQLGTILPNKPASTSTTSGSSPLPTVLPSTTSQNSTSTAPSSTAAATITSVPSTTADGSTQFPSSVTSSSNSTVPTTAIGGDGSSSHKSARASIIGGVLGGLTFLALLLALSLLCVRRRRSQWPFTKINDNQEQSSDHKRASTILSFFHRRDSLETIPYPLIPHDNYSQPESKLERFHRVQREMHEARRQRDLLRLNLSGHSSVKGSVGQETTENDLEGNEIEQKLRQRYDSLSAWVLELEAQLEAIELPPDYTSSGHA